MTFLQTNDKRTRGVLWLFFFWIVLRNTWLCEDAYITFRVVDNVAHGLGPRWNPLERVQVYTHPLWMWCVSGLYFLTHDVYVAAVALSLACSGAAVWLLLSRGMLSAPQRVLAGVVVSFSKAFVDYSTSGLENPLSHLLLVLYFIEYLKPPRTRSLRTMVWLVGLGLVNRMDLLFLFLPPLLHLVWVNRAWRPREWRVWLGLSPFVAWEIFSTLYYGFPFPNSAYAKLTAHVGRGVLINQGLCYLLNSLSWDPITLFAVTALVWVGFRSASREPRLGFLSLGVVLHLAYVVKIGGDYMSGRFLTAPFLVSLFVLSRVELEGSLQFVTALGACLALGIYSPRPPIQTNDQYVGLGSSPQSVDDEHGYRHGDTSFLRLSRDHSLADIGGWVADGLKAKRDHERVTVYRNIGYYGFFAGPDVHIIDPYGIGDPLMPRMRFPPGSPWSAGHFYRVVPEGYPKAAIGEGVIADPAIAAYWKKLELVTRGPVLSAERLREVVRFNVGLEPAP